MIGTVNVRVSAAHPDVQLREVPVLRGSACTVGIEGVPAFFGSASVTSVSVGMRNALGEARAVAAKRAGCMWVATFSADFFGAPGSVRNGLTVGAGGIEEDGVTAASWILGKGDVCIIDGDAVPAPGEVWTNVHLRDSVPSAPVKGDLAKVGDVWKVFDGVAWRALGGSSVVESETNPGYAAHADAALAAPWDGLTGRPTTFAPSAHAATHATGGSDPLSPESIGGPFLKVDADGNVDSLHAYGEVVAETKMQTTNVEAFASIKKAGEEVATEAQVSAVYATSAYPIAATAGALADRTINHATAGGTFTFPARTGTNARDFVLVIDALSTAPTVTFPAGVTYVSDQDAADVWTAEADKVNAWYFSEVGDGVFMVVHKAMASVAQ